MEPEHDIANIGTELVGASLSTERSPGEVLNELFPYVHEASRRMSTRSIRDWLKENHGIQISQPTLSRALRSPGRYWRAFAEYIEPWARRVEEAVPGSMQDFLFDARLFRHFIKDLPPAKSFPEESDERVEYGEIEEAADFLEDRWFSLSEESRLQCRRYLRQMDQTEGEA